MTKIDDKIIIAILVYIFLVSLVGATLPQEIFIASLGSSSMDQESMISEYNRTYTAPSEPIGQISWFRKIITVLFVPFIIPGIPLGLSLLIGFFNYLVAFLGGMYVFDKFRGI